jgi:hypothetical protein
MDMQNIITVFLKKRGREDQEESRSVQSVERNKRGIAKFNMAPSSARQAVGGGIAREERGLTRET